MPGISDAGKVSFDIFKNEYFDNNFKIEDKTVAKLAKNILNTTIEDLQEKHTYKEKQNAIKNLMGLNEKLKKTNFFIKGIYSLVNLCNLFNREEDIETRIQILQKSLGGGGSSSITGTKKGQQRPLSENPKEKSATGSLKRASDQPGKEETQKKEISSKPTETTLSDKPLTAKAFNHVVYEPTYKDYLDVDNGGFTKVLEGLLEKHKGVNEKTGKDLKPGLVRAHINQKLTVIYEKLLKKEGFLEKTESDQKALIKQEINDVAERFIKNGFKDPGYKL